MKSSRFRRAPFSFLAILAASAWLLDPTGASAETQQATPAAAASAAAAEESRDDEAEAAAAASADAGEAEPATPVVQGPTGDTKAQLDAGSGVRVKLMCTNCNAASLWVNGLTGEHVRVTMDGMPTVSGLGTVYALSQFPADLISHSHVTHGPGSVLSGSAAIGGTINLHSIEPTTEARALLEVQADDDGYNGLRLAGADRWGPFGALAYIQAAEGNVVDADGNGWPEIAEMERVTAQGAFDFHLTDRQVMTVDLFSYGEDQHHSPGGPSYDIPSASIQKQDEATFFNMQGYGLRWKRNGPSGLNLSFAGRYSRRGHQQWTAPERDPVAWTFLIEDEQSSARFQAEIPLGAGVLTTGTSWSHMNLQVDQSGVPPTSQVNPVGQPRFLVDNLDQWEVWLEHSRSLGKQWDLTVGGRGDWYAVYGRQVRRERFPLPEQEYNRRDPRLEYARFAPRAQAHWRPNPKFVLGMAAGLGSLGPIPAFTETCCGAKYQRSLKLRPEDAVAYQVSTEVHPTQDMRLAVRLFRTDFEDYQQKVVYKSDGYVAYYTRVNVPRARIQGVDLVHDMRFKDGRYNVGWTWTYTDHEGSEILATNDQNELLLDRNGNPYVVSPEGADLAFVPRHAGSAYLRYQHPVRGLSLNLNASFQSSLKHFQLSEFIRQATAPWPMLDSSSYWTADFDFEQRIGVKGWSAFGGVRNLNDRVQDDIGRLDRIYDWGPIQGRTAFVGMKFVR